MILALALFSCTADASAFTITITTNGYRGNISVDKGPLEYITTEEWRLDLQAGPHALETGAGVALSNITFTVGADGAVGQLAPSAAASPGIALGTIVFNTVPLTVLPGKYTGDYLLSAYKAGPRVFRGKQQVVLIAGLVYHLDNIAGMVNYWCAGDKCDRDAAFPSAFLFSVSATGVVKVENPAAAWGSTKGRLLLKSTAVRITRDMIPTNGYVTWCGDKNTHITAPTSITVIPGLSTWLKRSDQPKEKYFVERMFDTVSPAIPVP